MRQFLLVVPLVGLLAVMVAGCGSEPADYTGFGPYTVGYVRVELTDAARNRTIPVGIWYPATEAVRDQFERGGPLTELFSASEKELAAPLFESPSECMTTTAHSVRDAKPGPGKWPLVIYSHCSACLRTSNVSIVERLVSHGFAVVAADHIGDTLWDSLRGEPGSGLSGEFLEIRGQDCTFLLDTFLDPENPDVPAAVRGRFDENRVAMFGHSFGAVTSGLVTTTDPRVRGAVLHAAPFAGFYYLVQPEQNTKPIFTILAAEDAMITYAGNELIRQDFARLGGPCWKAEVQDAGHLSFGDVCRISESYFDCCGEGARQSDQSWEVFTYMDQAMSMGLAATWTTAFMAWLLLDDPSARAVFEDPGDERVSIEVRNAPVDL
ncbi:hypothetical protein KBA39_08120 [Myxococcota bacterium]|nr:hypothetical protein [Myxococcota bacterium]